MTTGIDAVRKWNEQTDTEKSRADTVFRVMAAAGQLPLSGRGGGKLAVHWEALHIVRHAVGIATAEPANTADKSTLEFMNLHRHPGLGGLLNADKFNVCKETIGETLTSLVERVASDPPFAKALHDISFEVNFGLGRPTAYITYKEAGSTPFVLSYVMQDDSAKFSYKQPTRSTQRWAGINSHQIEMLAEFLRDTWEKKGRLLSNPSMSSNSADGLPDDTSGSKNDDGANLPGKAPSTRNQSRRKKASSGLNNREANAKRDFCHASRGGESGQSPSGDGSFTSSRSFSDDSNKRYSAAAASPCS